jgi:hypothetical protein
MNANGDTHPCPDGDAGWKAVAIDSPDAAVAVYRLFRAYPSALNPESRCKVRFRHSIASVLRPNDSHPTDFYG